MGLYTESGAPQWHNAPSHVRMAIDLAFTYCKERGVSLTKLALFFSISCNIADMSIVSMSSEDFVRDNVELVNIGLNEYEKKILDEIRNL